MTQDVDDASLRRAELSVAFTVAFQESLRHWRRTNPDTLLDWSDAFGRFAHSMYGEFMDIGVDFHSESPDPSLRRLRERLVTEVRSMLLAESIDIGLADEQVGRTEELEPEQPRELMRLAVETALISLETEGSENSSVVGASINDGSRDQELADLLGVTTVATAGLSGLVELFGWRRTVIIEACQAHDLEETDSRALESMLFDLRGRILQRFTSHLFDWQWEWGPQTAQWLSLIPTLDFIVGKVRSRGPRRPSPRRDRRPWEQNDVELVRYLAARGRTRYEIAHLVDRPVSHLDEILGTGEWREWTVFELEVLDTALSADIGPIEEMGDLLDYRDDELFARWGYRAESQRSPWDIALRVRSILYGLDPYWTSVGLAASDSEPVTLEGAVRTGGETPALDSPSEANASASTTSPRTAGLAATLRHQQGTPVTEIELPSGTDRICVRGSEIFILDTHGSVLLKSGVDSPLDLTFPDPPADWSDFKTFIRARIPRAYFPWDSQEDEEVRVAFVSGIPIHRIAEQQGRSQGAIRSRLVKLGLLGD